MKPKEQTSGSEHKISSGYSEVEALCVLSDGRDALAKAQAEELDQSWDSLLIPIKSTSHSLPTLHWIFWIERVEIDPSICLS